VGEGGRIVDKAEIKAWQTTITNKSRGKRVFLKQNYFILLVSLESLSVHYCHLLKLLSPHFTVHFIICPTHFSVRLHSLSPTFRPPKNLPPLTCTTQFILTSSWLVFLIAIWLTQNQNNVSEWSDRSTRGLLFQWASTIKIQLSVLVQSN
jgi:hypothetical protein